MGRELMAKEQLTDLESLFESVCGEYLRTNDCLSTRGDLGVFSQAAVIWLGVQQRLSGNSLQSSLGRLVSRIQDEASPIKLVLHPGTKIQSGDISLNTGGISRARDRLPEEVTKELFYVSAKNILERTGNSSNIYLLDGAVITAARTESTLRHLGRTRTGAGEFHFPKMRVIAAHHLETGVAASIALGTYQQSESTLAERVIEELPVGSIVIMDRYFDKPKLLHQACERGLKVVLRIKDKFARKHLGSSASDSSAEVPIVWIPSAKAQRHLQVSGRVFKFTAAQSGFRSSEFFFFTSASDLSLDEVAVLYRKRVQVELYIRQLKQTLKLFFVRAKKAANLQKEIFIAYLTFNLLRGLMSLAAQSAGVAPERMSFTATMTLCDSYASAFLRSKDNQERESLFKKFVTNLTQAKLPVRKKPRSFPRLVKSSRGKYNCQPIVRRYNYDGRR